MSINDFEKLYERTSEQLNKLKINTICIYIIERQRRRRSINIDFIFWNFVIEQY